MSRLSELIKNYIKDFSVSDSARRIFKYQFLTIAFALASNIIIARQLGPEKKGLVDIFVLIYMLILEFGLCGFGNGLFYQITQKKRPLAQAHGTGIAFAVIAGILIALIGWFALPIWQSIFPGIPRWIILAAFILTPLVFYKQIWENIMTGANRAVVIYKVANIFSIIQLCAIVTLWILDRFSYEMIIYWSIFRIALNTITSFFIIPPQERKLRADLSLAKDALKYGSVIYAGALANVLHFKIDQVMISYWLGLEAVGIYTVSVRWAETLFFLDAAILAASLYRISSSSPETSFRATRQVFRTQIVISLVAGTLFALLAYPLVNVLYGEAYADAALPLIILIPGIIAWSTSKSLSNLLTYNLGLGAFLTKVSFGGLLANVILNYYMIKVLGWGINGAAIASSISYFLVAVAVVIQCKYQEKKHAANETAN
jgi:O-antigen/teichoic acid export membrane protein